MEGGGRCWGLCGTQRDENEKFGQKSKPGERDEACSSFYFGTVEPRYNETLYNEVLGITNDIFTMRGSLSNDDDGGVLSMAKRNL